MSHPSALLTTPALREVADIVEAACEQGWDLQRAGHHLKLVPPDPSTGVPVGLAGSPSNKFWRHQIIRQLRRSGVVWPWPPTGGNKKLARAQRNQEKKKMITASEPVLEAWRTLDTMSKYEISNGARCRNKLTGKLIEVAPNGIVVLTDDKGRRREKSVRALVRAHFGHSPIKNVIPQNGAVHRTREALRIVEPPPPINQEKPMTAVLEAPVSTNGHSTSTEHWEPVLIEGVIEGYEVNENAEVLAPKNEKFHQRSRLIPQPGKFPRVNLRTVEGKYKLYRLDAIVLEAFKVRPGEHWVPEHIDGNEENCRIDNLRWSEGDQKPRKTEAEQEPAPPAVVADEPSEPQEPDPPVVERLGKRITERHQQSMRELLDSVQADVVVPVIDRATGEEVTLEDQARVEHPEAFAEESGDKPKRKRRAAKKSATKKPPRQGIQRFRSYKLNNLSITVDADGNADLSKAKKLSPQETADMAALLADVAESNKFFGIS